MSNEQIWFITGASSGFGQALAEAAVADGDRVVGAARRPGALTKLAEKHPGQVESVQLDVTDGAAVGSVVADVEARYGRIDILVNNAGHGQVGAVEETTDEELRSLFELHFFGPTALIKAVLPGMRSRRSGAVVQMSSMGGQIGLAGFSAYSATKFALEGFSESLAAEVAPFGIRVLVVEPGAFRTSFSGGGLAESEPLEAYAATVGETRKMIKGMDGQQPGDPAKAAAAILAALNAEEAPLRLPLGADAVEGILDHGEGVRDEVKAWEDTARDTSYAEAG
jgi:NAD(P)-dependent dehydrogenase (short-subunit alcohol dehydrogenase family)